MAGMGTLAGGGGVMGMGTETGGGGGLTEGMSTAVGGGCCWLPLLSELFLEIVGVLSVLASGGCLCGERERI